MNHLEALGALRERFREVWLVDTEFRAPPGERQSVVCLTAQEYLSGREVKLWRDDLLRLRAPPFGIGPDNLIVAFFASAECGSFLELPCFAGRLPVNILDLYCEHRAQTNGFFMPFGNSLLGALQLRQLDRVTRSYKETARGLIMKQDSWTAAQHSTILDYGMSDSRALGPLLDYLLPRIEWPYALLRGRYMAAVARMERIGVPLDRALWLAFKEVWETLKERLITGVDKDYGVYDRLAFNEKLFLEFIERHRIDWPLHPSGHPMLDSDVFRDMADRHPKLLRPLHELRSTTAKLRLVGLSVGADGRNRCLLSPFRSKTGRNQPSNSKFIFGSSRWLRGLIKPPEGHAIAYVDWSGQEFAIAAARFEDQAMIADYQSGDPHLAFAKRNGMAPEDATADSEPHIRDVCKTINLGTLYGLTEYGLAARLGVLPVRARQLLRLHRETYRGYWSGSEGSVFSALQNNVIVSSFGWPLRITGDPDKKTMRSLQNFPMQADGAEMMRIASIAATEAGLPVCCPVHDAFLLCSPLGRIDGDVARLRAIMRKAGLAVTGGALEVRTDPPKIIRSPDRYMDKRGVEMWNRATGLLAEIRGEKVAA